MLFLYNANPKFAAEQVPDGQLVSSMRDSLQALKAVWKGDGNLTLASWLAESSFNYRWLAAYCFQLHNEHCLRFDSLPASVTEAKNLQVCVPNTLRNSQFTTNIPTFLGTASIEATADAMRHFLLNRSAAVHTWTKQSTPSWYATNLLNRNSAS